MHKGWHSRGYLPHFDAPNLIQGITFRLWDALPAHVEEMLAAEIDEHTNIARRTQLEGYLNAGHGACFLRDPRIATLVEQALWHFDGERYRLIAWVVMPNHVHTVAETIEGHPLSQVVHSWKSFTATEANKILGRTGQFWFRDYFDRYIRDERHLANAIRYVHYNPVAAGLAEEPEDWPYSSARFYREGKGR